ncbi:MAG: ABC-type multidrug transport system, ATPase component [Clostridia bacterium]|jgi:ABC-2 type transport system ATP-binding protein|nr:ABC-type multidrug transport system, ATPase component [Clostridia bacterium]
MKKTILKLDGITKKYDQNTVVDHISLEIKQGEIFGLLGPNGAGKSTTINMICSMIKQSAGDISLFGQDNRKGISEVKHKLGLVPQEIAVHENLKAWENIEFFAGLYGIKGKALKKAIDEALDFVGLTENKNGYVKTFSGGMKRRLNIACAIAHHPELMIFDEPTVAIDPQSRNFILEKIRAMNRAGATIIYTSHYMEEVEVLCDRIAIMDKGKVIALGTKEELVSLVAPEGSDMSLEEVFLKLTGKNLRDYREEGL